MQTNETNETHPLMKSSDRTWVLMCHLSALAMFLFPFGHVVGPLLIWLSKRDSDPEINEHGRASLNFQLSVTLYGMVLTAALVFAVLGFGAAAIGGAAVGSPAGAASAFGSAVIGVILVVCLASMIGFLGLANLVLIAVNSIRSYDGKPPFYPLAIRFLRS